MTWYKINNLISLLLTDFIVGAVVVILAHLIGILSKSLGYILTMPLYTMPHYGLYGMAISVVIIMTLGHIVVYFLYKQDIK